MSLTARVTLEFPPHVCPIGRLAADTDATVDVVATPIPAGDDRRAAELLVDAGDPSTAILDSQSDVEGLAIEHIAHHGTVDRFRVIFDGTGNCPCACLESFACPLDRYVVRDGRLSISFYVSEREQLEAVIADFKSQFPEMNVTRLIQSSGTEIEPNKVLVDVGKLTPRQAEALWTAFEMGFFEYPRRANATEVAAELGVSRSTFSEHLARGQAKVFEDQFDRPR